MQESNQIARCMIKENFFKYSEIETGYLSEKDKLLGSAISKIGHIDRQVIPDLFTAFVHAIAGQQISTKAHITIWNRIVEGYSGIISPEVIIEGGETRLGSFGLSKRKIGYIFQFAKKILSGEFDIDSLYKMDDGDVRAALTKLSGVGMWTAEMIMIFSMQRKNVLSYGDLGILRGLRMLYGHKKITRELFLEYELSFAPYASIASFYLWKISGGAIAGLKDPALENGE